MLSLRNLYSSRSRDFIGLRKAKVETALNSRMVPILILLMALSALAAASTLVVIGKWHDLFGDRFSAEIQLHEVAVPSAFRIDPVLISNEIVSRMTQRTETDAALRIILSAGQNELLRDRAIPRLVNPGVIRQMLDEMEGLGTVSEFATYKSYARVSIQNQSPDLLSDVALVLPHAKRAESGDAANLNFRVAKDKIGSISIPSLQPGEIVEFDVWLDALPGKIVEEKPRILLGADGSVRGEVRVYGATSDWNGADLEIHLWARWLVALFCVSIAFAALSGAVLTLVARTRGRPGSSAVDATDLS